jgi:U3 small nucleolar RNA-associated protein 16
LTINRQESALRQKRKERDTVLKKQAESASKKRKREAVRGKAKGSKKVGSRENQDEHKLLPKFAIGTALPDLLPAEYLQDEESENGALIDSEPAEKKPKKMKFTDLVEKKPKDRRKGSTIYRVSEVRSTKLAPKASPTARSLKESWLQGRPGKVLGTNRKPFSGGFFKKK